MSHRVVNRRRAQFFQVENELLDVHARRMGIYAYAIYTGLIRISGNNDDDRCFPSYEYLAVMFDISKNTVITSMKKLEKLGYIAISRYLDRCANCTTPEDRVIDYDPYDESEKYSNIYTILDFEQIELEEKYFVPLGLLKKDLVDRGNKERNARRRKARIQARQTAVVAVDHEVTVQTAPLAVTRQPKIVQTSLFDEPVEITPPKHREPAVKKPELIPEAHEAFDYYRAKFGRGPVDGGGTKAWFEEQIREFGNGNDTLGLRRMKCAITYARGRNLCRLSNLRSVLEQQTVEEIRKYDANGNLKKMPGRVSGDIVFNDDDASEGRPSQVATAVKEKVFTPLADLVPKTERYAVGFADNPVVIQMAIDRYRGFFTPYQADEVNALLEQAYSLHEYTLNNVAPEEVMGKMIPRIRDAYYKNGIWPRVIPMDLPGVTDAKIDFSGKTPDNRFFMDNLY